MTSFDMQLYSLVDAALREDVGEGDHTTLSCIPPQAKGRAVLKIKQDGVISGVEVAKKIFLHRDPEFAFEQHKADGERMLAGETAFEVEGSVHLILQLERLVLNCMQRMSGITTLTRQFTEKLTGYRTRLLDTRKTTPNFRLLEKEAVRIGGGVNHRFGLFDMIMLKDNHIDYCGSIEEAVRRAHAYVTAYQPHLRIEVETRSMDDVRRLIAIGAGRVHRVMLDNFRPAELAEALELIAGRFETEASGGINLENLEDYAATGVDFVSVGGLVHQARSLDLSLKAIII